MILAEAETELGGRVLLESKLKGLSSWLRVRDFREQTLLRRSSVSIYRDSKLSATDILELGYPHVMVATGAHWRRDGVGRSQRKPINIKDHNVQIRNADDIMRGIMPSDGPIVVYDDEQGYLGGVIADHLSSEYEDVSFVTPASVVSPWTVYTLEQERIQAALIHQGVKISISRKVVSVHNGQIETACMFGGQTSVMDCSTLILITERFVNNSLVDTLREQLTPDQKLPGVTVIGDALAPGLIADAVFSGHLAARDFQRDPQLVEQELYRREMPSLTHC